LAARGLSGSIPGNQAPSCQSCAPRCWGFDGALAAATACFTAVAAAEWLARTLLGQHSSPRDVHHDGFVQVAAGQAPSHILSVSTSLLMTGEPCNQSALQVIRVW
jgi:hypothetical protein